MIQINFYNTLLEKHDAQIPFITRINNISV
jgi:hypothetical protein